MQINITPFLIANPVIMVWSLVITFSLQGFAAIMGPIFITTFFVALVTLILDRFFIHAIKRLHLIIGEIVFWIVYWFGLNFHIESGGRWFS